MISTNNYNVNWGDYFYYDETSPSFLRWNCNIYSGKSYTLLSIKANSVAGTKQFRKSGQPSKWMVKLKGKNYSVSKIVYILKHGWVPNLMIIDHIDRNPFNNLIENLRVATESENLKNKNTQSNNSSGFTGVSAVVKEGILYYSAYWQEEPYKQKRLNFNTVKLGKVLAKVKAVVSRYDGVKNIGGYELQHLNFMEDEDNMLLKQAAEEIYELRAAFIESTK